MKKQDSKIYQLDSISTLHRLLKLPPPVHPLISVLRMEDVPCQPDIEKASLVYHFYSICAKKGFNGGRLKYGQTYYDFDAGVMTFFAPGQVTLTEPSQYTDLTGWWVLIHPDFLRLYPIGKRMSEYGYFSYAANEALHLSDAEDNLLATLVQQIDRECRAGIDSFTQDILVSQLEVLLNYCNRFYNRQFLTRKAANSELLTRLETIMDAWFANDGLHTEGLPTVQYLAAQLTVSPGYLSDMLRSQTGQSAQQHIHSKLIDHSKKLLSTTSLSVSEIAYQLGFSYPQSFNKLFKSKTDLSPLEFRQSFN